MKRVIFLAIAMLFVSSCSETSEPTGPSSSTEPLNKISNTYLTNIYDVVGPTHNKGMNYLIPKLSAMWSYLAPKPRDLTVDYIIQQTDIFWNSNPISLGKSSEDIDPRLRPILLHIANETELQAAAYIEHIADSLVSEAIREQKVVSLSQAKKNQKRFLSSTLANCLLQLKTQVRQYSPYYPVYQNLLNKGTSSSTTEPNYENLILYSSASVSHYSSQFWHNFNPPTPSTQGSGGMKKIESVMGVWGVVGAIDLAGALIAAVFYIWDAICSGEFSAWGYIKAVTKGAIAASATAAVGRLWPKW